jgi:hypothetical protein
MSRNDNSYEAKLKAAGVYEPLSTLLATDSVEKTLALGTGVKSYIDLTTANIAMVGKSGLITIGEGTYNYINGIGSIIFNKFITPESLGAAGTGVVNDSMFFTSGITYLTIGKIYRISTNVSCGVIFNGGGLISVDSGVVFECAEVIGPNYSAVFMGLGIVKTKNFTYHIGWFSGNSLNEKWDFLRRGFHVDQHYICYWDKPSRTDSGAIQSSYQGVYSWHWNVTSPIIFDDPENNGTIYANGRLSVSANITSALLFSVTNKTEEISFPVGIWINGNFNCDFGILMNGGARIIFCGSTYVKEVRLDGLYLEPILPVNITALDEISFDFVNVTNFGRYGIQIYGHAQVQPVGNILGIRIKHLFTNGGAPLAYYANSSPIAVLCLKGVHRGVHIDYIEENTNYSSGQLDCSKALVQIVTTSDGAPQGVYIGHIQARGNIATALLTEYSNLADPSSCEVMVGKITTITQTGNQVTLGRSNGSSIGRINSGVLSYGAIVLNSDATRTNIVGNNLSCINGVSDYSSLNGVQFLTRNLGNNGVIGQNFYGNAITLLLTSTVPNVWLQAQLLSGGTIQIISVGSLVDISSVVLTGTTGTVGRFTVSCSGGLHVYMENRTGVGCNAVLRGFEV